MTRIQRYAFKEMLGPTIVGLMAYGLILLMNLALQTAEMAIRRDLPLQLVAEFIVLSLPRILVLTIPMAVLVGVLVGVGRLMADNEIAALKALGRNVRGLGWAAALLGLLAGLLTFAVFDAAVPAANYAQHQLQARIFVSSDLNRELQPRAFYEKIPDLLVYADAADPATGTLERVLFYQKGKEGEEEISTAGRARIEYQESGGALDFRLEDVVSHSWNRKKPDDYQITRREEETIVRPPDIFTREMLHNLENPPPRNLREQNVRQLLTSLRESEATEPGPGADRIRSETLVEIHKKFSIPATCVIFAVLGLPLALSQRRGGKAWGFLISLLIIALQYFLLTAGEQLADNGRIEPWAAMWGGNIAFGLLAAVLLTVGSGWSWDPRAILASLRRRREKEHEDERLAEPESRPPVLASGPVLRPAKAAGDSPAGDESEEAKSLPAVVIRFWRRWFPAVDLYLLRTLGFVGMLVALSLSLLFALYATLDFMQNATPQENPMGLLFQYVVNVLPQFFTNYVLPLDLCAATLITFALLSRTQELTALRSAGVGPIRISAVFLAVACVATVLTFGALDSVLPATNQKAMQIRDKIRGRSPRSYSHPERRWVFGSHGELLTFRNLVRERNQLLGLNVMKFVPGSFTIQERTFAPRATWEPGKGWVLERGWVRSFTPSGEEYRDFDTLTLPGLDGPDYFSQEWKAPAQMNMVELRAYVADMERRGYETRELRVGLHRKLAVPAVCIVMVLIALPFGLRIDRRGPLFGLGVSLLIAGIYYFAMQASGKLGEVGVLPPILAAWAPNILFSGTGLYLMASSRW